MCNNYIVDRCDLDLWPLVPTVEWQFEYTNAIHHSLLDLHWTCWAWTNFRQPWRPTSFCVLSLQFPLDIQKVSYWLNFPTFKGCRKIPNRRLGNQPTWQNPILVMCFTPGCYWHNTEVLFTFHSVQLVELTIYGKVYRKLLWLLECSCNYSILFFSTEFNGEPHNAEWMIQIERVVK